MDRAIEADEGLRARRAAVDEFVEGLRRLRLEAGQPAFRTMAKVSGKVSHATLHDALTGARLPTWPTVAAFVAACGGDLAVWRQRWLAAAQEARPDTEGEGPGLLPDQATAETVESLAAGTQDVESAEVAPGGVGSGDLRPARPVAPGQLGRPVRWGGRRVAVLAFLAGLVVGAAAALGVASWAGFGVSAPVACPTSDADLASGAHGSDVSYTSYESAGSPASSAVPTPAASAGSSAPAGSSVSSAPSTGSAPQGAGAPAWVGRPAFDAQILTGTAVSLPVTSPVTAGDALVVTLMLTSTCPGQVSVTDTLGDAFSLVGDDTDTARHRTMLFAAFGVKPLTTADAIHVAYPHASKYHVAVDEFRGIGEVVGRTHAHGESGGVAFSTGPSLDCASGELLVAAVGTNTGTAPTLVDGWTTLPVLKLSSYRLTTGYRIVTAPGACAVTGTTTAQWGAALAAFR